MVNHLKYAVSAKALEILEEEGYVALLRTENSEEIKSFQAVQIKEENILPKGAEFLVDGILVTDYGQIILLAKENTLEKGDAS